MTEGIVIVSGGMDSVTLAHHFADKGYGLRVVSFNYGQRHSKELTFAERCAERIGAPWELVDLSGLAAHLTGSALTDDAVDVPPGHYAEETMRATVVPNRNAIMLSVATGIAVAHGASFVAAGMHGGDHYIYPDCRPEFVVAMAEALRRATDGFAASGFGLATPFLHMTKADIARLGENLGVPWLETWSCYEGGETHCGACGTCFERREAFMLADVHDPTPYVSEPQYEAPS